MTADPAAFRALAQRAREASGPDRALDADVAEMFGWRVLREPSSGWLANEIGFASPDDRSTSEVPIYTDLDGLGDIIRDVVPKGLRYSIDVWPDQRTLAHVANTSGRPFSAFAAAPALALLAVSLEARAAIAETAHDR